MIPLFIGGTGRSGTTIALSLIGTHSKAYATIPSEIKILTEKNGLLEKYVNKEIDKNNVILFYKNIFKNQNILKNNVKYWADSTPDNIRSSEIISKIFPDAMFIHMIRDGRDSGYSEYEIMNGKFHAQTPFDGLEFWRKRIIQSVESLRKVDLTKQITIRLEDLVISNREIEKNKILAFLNLKEEELFNNFFNSQVIANKMSVGKWKLMKNWKEYDLRYTLVLEELKSRNIIIEKGY
jgi:hypothetical protein